MVYVVCVTLLLCAAASFFFAAAEAALFSLGRWRVRVLTTTQAERGRLIAGLLATPQDLLATMTLGNTLCNALMVALVTGTGVAGHTPAWLVLPALLVLLLLGCELIPKTLAVREPEYWALRVAGPMHLVMRLTRPFRQLARWLNRGILTVAARRSIVPTAGITDEEYRELVEMACQQGTLETSEKEIILQIIGLDRRTVGEVMKPRSQMAAVSDDATREEMIEAARRHRHQRLPIYDESPDTIVGILNTRTLLLNPEVDLAEAIEFPSFVPSTMNLLQLFKSLQRQRRGLAIVLDEFGGTAGIVTMEDILEAIVGDLRNEGETAGFRMEKLDENRWRVSGTMRLEDFQREYPALGEYPGVETLGGLVVALREMVPAVGESVVFRGLRLTVTAADERRVQELLIERLPGGRGKGGGA